MLWLFSEVIWTGNIFYKPKKYSSTFSNILKKFNLTYNSIILPLLISPCLWQRPGRRRFSCRRCCSCCRRCSCCLRHSTWRHSNVTSVVVVVLFPSLWHLTCQLANALGIGTNLPTLPCSLPHTELDFLRGRFGRNKMLSNSQLFFPKCREIIMLPTWDILEWWRHCYIDFTQRLSSR